ncbi:MAG: glycosyl hydrolase family 18 protein [Eubacteriales bacterium]|nr:glycosyl hydrolase family 18 protein [Eubacteriales bacterium]
MIYVVKNGDSLYSISQEFGVPEERIIYQNQLYGQEYLAVGQALLLTGTGLPEEKINRLYVTGYAYPFIEPYLLQEAAPSLNELLVFSYGFTAEGELVPPILSDLNLIETAWRNGAEPFLVLTPFGEDGRFNNNLVKIVSEDMEVQGRLIENLLDMVREKGYAGVDVDFEYILPENRVQYAEFVGNLRRQMNENGYRVSVALAPKTSADQPGLLYEGVDYRLLGENADQVFLMTYEWGYTYGPPMAVAPINKVRQVVEYALTEIPADKILMGIPNYAYDWPLPFERGSTAARTIGNVEAVRIAEENGAEIQFDETARSPYFTYRRDQVEHEVWFEDVRSIEAKLRLAAGYGLKGVGYWNLMRPFRANWVLLDQIMR